MINKSEMWVARNKKGDLWLSIQKPQLVRIADAAWFSVASKDIERDYQFEMEYGTALQGPCGWNKRGGVRLNPNMFPEVTFENSPQRITLNI